MMKKHILTIAVILVLSMMIVPISAKIFSIDDAQATISLKTVSSAGVISKDAVEEKDLKTDVVQTIQMKVSKIGKTTETKTVQLYPSSTILVKTDFAGTTNVMQVSSNTKYPRMEVYYRYQKSKIEPWRYYFRVEQFKGTKAKVVYSDFYTKKVWLGTMTKATYDAIIASGKIPEWSTINK